MLECETREQVSSWIWLNQLNKRNLTAESITYYRGKLHEQRKQPIGGTGANQHTKVQSDQNYISAPRTAKAMGKEYGVGEATIRRDAAFAKAVDMSWNQRIGISKGLFVWTGKYQRPP